MNYRLCLLALLIFFTSCNRKVQLLIKTEDPDVVPLINEKLFYSGVKTFSIKTNNQNIIYSSKEMSSDINVFIATIEKEFIKSGYKVIPEKGDITIEIISIDHSPIFTNVVKKPNGKFKTYSNCNFSTFGTKPLESTKAFIRVIKNKDIVHYTYYFTPCSDDDKNKCIGTIDRHCNINPNIKKVKRNIAYQTDVKSLLPVERIAVAVALNMIHNIES